MNKTFKLYLCNYLFGAYLIMHIIAGIGAIWFEAGKMGPSRIRIVHNMSNDVVSEQEQINRAIGG
jgi:hypothetical protein